MPQQLAAIGLSANGQTLADTQLYKAPPPAALGQCLDPSGGDWENIDPPEPDEWLDAMLEKTPDQSFSDFVASRPNRPDRRRCTVLLQPICAAEELQGPSFPAGPWPSWQFLEAAVSRFYAPMNVRTLPAVPMEELGRPPVQSRMNSYGLQWHAGQVLDRLAARGMPSDAYCMLAVTMCDLYPREEWNFVYGLARLFARVGIFSFVRHTPFQQADEAWLGAQLLHRATKTMLHEIGHMFGMKHCTWYNCLMRGSNGEEVEHQKNCLHLCPVCLRKLHWSVGFDIRSQYASLLELYETYEVANECFGRDCDFLRRRLSALGDLPEGATMLHTIGNTRRSVPAPTRRVVGSRAPARESPSPASSARTSQGRTTTPCVERRRVRSPTAIGGTVVGTPQQQQNAQTSATSRQVVRVAARVGQPQQAAARSLAASPARA